MQVKTAGSYLGSMFLGAALCGLMPACDEKHELADRSAPADEGEGCEDGHRPPPPCDADDGECEPPPCDADDRECKPPPCGEDGELPPPRPEDVPCDGGGDTGGHATTGEDTGETTGGDDPIPQ